MSDAIEAAIEWLDNGGLPWFLVGVVACYSAAMWAISGVRFEESNDL